MSFEAGLYDRMTFLIYKKHFLSLAQIFVISQLCYQEA